MKIITLFKKNFGKIILEDKLSLKLNISTNSRYPFY